MKPKNNFSHHWYQPLIKTTILALLLLTFSLGLSGAGFLNNDNSNARKSSLAAGNAITDPYALLRYALPIDNATVRKLQGDIEDISNHLRGKRWAPIVKDIKDAGFILKTRSDQILASIPEATKPQAQTLLDGIATQVKELQDAATAKDREAVGTKRGEILSQITTLEELMVTGFPFQVPEEYANLPQLKGRATVEMETTKGNLTIIVDGYSAPVNGGNFIDLVHRGFYDGLAFTRDEDNYILQAGDPPGQEYGFIDPKTDEYRAIPLEVLVKGDPAPIYGITLEDAGIYLPDLALPFSAYGTVALARPSDDPNGGSSQFFFLKFDNELTPPGFNVVDGRYSVFGYLVKGKDVLDQLHLNDKIISAKVVDGLENLVGPQVKSSQPSTINSVEEDTSSVADEINSATELETVESTDITTQTSETAPTTEPVTNSNPV